MGRIILFLFALLLQLRNVHSPVLTTDRTPFTPRSPGCRCRAGVYADQMGNEQQHMRCGKCYTGRISGTFPRAGVIEVGLNISANYNGFLEAYLCGVEKCGGDISEQCLREGHCYHLLRAKDDSCDSGFDPRCPLIDPDFPHIWYLPCSPKPENTAETMRGPKVKFRFPEGLSCDNCVVHWIWSSVNTCDPADVISFF